MVSIVVVVIAFEGWHLLRSGIACFGSGEGSGIVLPGRRRRRTLLNGGGRYHVVRFEIILSAE